MISENIPDLIKTYVPFVRSRKEWETCICPICNDYKDRGGFVLDTNEIVYHCFNCGYDAKYAIGETYITKKMNAVLVAYGIDQEVINKAVNYYFFNKPQKTTKTATSEITYPKKIELPTSFRKLILDNNQNTCDEVYCEYLKSRNLNPSDNYYVSESNDYYGYLIIPYTRFNNFIYWQGRNILADDDAPRYINYEISKDSILFNFDLLSKHDLKRVYVAEGVFDSLSLPNNVIGLCGSSLCDNKIKILKASKKEIIFLVDSDSSGYNLAKKAISNGFKITHLENDTDINSYVCKYGKISTCVMLHKNIKSGLSAELYLKMLNNKITKEKKNRES